MHRKLECDLALQRHTAIRTAAMPLRAPQAIQLLRYCTLGVHGSIGSTATFTINKHQYRRKESRKSKLTLLLVLKVEKAEQSLYLLRQAR